MTNRWAVPQTSASKAFWQHWGDGKAELSGYRITTMRYGAKRQGELVLIYVTEPLDRRTLIKDDSGQLPRQQQLQVLKLNQMLRFNTGIYPYSVMTSVFAPVSGYGGERFSPAKIALSAQEWCGHVYQQVRPLEHSFTSSIRSYFSSEGEADDRVTVPAGALYEDALLIQLRELDGPFNGRQDWTGHLVPSLWRSRKAHVQPTKTRATIRRSTVELEGVEATRFELSFDGVTRTIDVQRAFPRRILGWSQSDGEQVSLLETVRLSYWRLNGLGDERYRQQLGL